jgi:hypothetical protein
MVKGDLRKQAYDIRQFDDPVYGLLPGNTEYQALDVEKLKTVEGGQAGF